MLQDYTVHIVTPGWFDDDTPNDLHPVGVVIDPVRRRVDVPSRIGVVVARPFLSDPNAVVPIHSIGAHCSAWVGDIILIYTVRKLSLRDVWRD